jgi:hypothetical protein
MPLTGRYARSHYHAPHFLDATTPSLTALLYLNFAVTWPSAGFATWASPGGPVYAPLAMPTPGLGYDDWCGCDVIDGRHCDWLQ